MINNALFAIFFVIGIVYGNPSNFLSTNICALNCGNSSDSRCQQISSEFCSCVDSSLNLDVAIMLDGIGSEFKEIWNVIKGVIVDYLELIVSNEPNVNVTTYIFGNNSVNSYGDPSSILSVDLPDNSSATTCNALQTIGRNLLDSFHDNKFVLYVAGKTPSDLNTCNLTFLNGINMYTFQFDSADLKTLQTKAESSGINYVNAGYCNSTCVNFLKYYSGDISIYRKKAAAYLGNWACQLNASSVSTMQPLNATLPVSNTPQGSHGRHQGPPPMNSGAPNMSRGIPPNRNPGGPNRPNASIIINPGGPIMPIDNISSPLGQNTTRSTTMTASHSTTMASSYSTTKMESSQNSWWQNVLKKILSVFSNSSKKKNKV